MKASDEFVIHLKSHDIVHFSLRVESKSGLWYLKVTSKSGFTSGLEQRKEDINHEYLAANFDANDAASISLYHIIQKIWKTLAMQPTICPFNTRGNFSVPSYNLHKYVDVKSIFVEVLLPW